MSVWDAGEMFILLTLMLVSCGAGWWVRGRKGGTGAGVSCPGWCGGGCDSIVEGPDDFRAWKAETARSKDGLTVLLDEVFPDGDLR